MIINKDTKLCLFNSRWGSRLTLNFNFSEHSIETGNLGMDVCYGRKINYSKQKLQQLKFYIKSGSSEEEGFYFSKLNSYLANQELTAGLTFIKLNGIHSSELKVDFIIRSPITIAPKLDDDDKIKIIHTPFFYIEVFVENLASINQNIEIFIGFDLDGLLINEDIIYKDKGINKIGGGKKELALRNFQKETEEYLIDDDRIFKGFFSTIELKAGEKLQYRYIYAGFVDDYVFLNKFDEKNPHKLKFYYTKFFTDIEQILTYAENNYESIIQETNNFEDLLFSYDASPEKKMIIAIAFRTFLANSWLLISESQKIPEYYVWQGVYAMNSSVDISMEVELLAKLFPWTLKLQLMEWKRYVTINKKNGLFYLKHDMGYDQEVGFSYYEESAGLKLGDITKIFPMPVEENANFTILLYWYYFITKNKDLLEELYPTAFKLSVANIKRGYRKRGIAHMSASTYNLSDTLHLSPLNTYLGIKECVAYIMCRELSVILGLNRDKDILQKEAEKIIDTLEYTKEKYGYIPVSLDTSYKGWNQKTIATADPLFYVGMTRLKDPIIEKIIELLRTDFDNTYYICTRNLYGIRLVEDEELTWFSKIAIIDAVSNILFQIPMDSYNYAYKCNENNPMAFCDGAFSENKESQDQKSPRGLSLMWEIIYNYKNLQLEKNK